MNTTLRSPRDFSNWLDGFLNGKDLLTKEHVEEIMEAADDTLTSMWEDAPTTTQTRQNEWCDDDCMFCYPAPSRAL